MKSLKHTTLIVLILLGLVLGSFAESTGACSFHQYATCHEYADCTNTVDGGFSCTCQANYYGDGLKNGTGCNGKQPCFADGDCHAYGKCTDHFCVCKSGFQGDGYAKCDDINECALNPCNENANCQNNLGGFTCTCKFNYKGDGVTCTFFCNINSDCHVNALCQNERCICKPGYEGDGRFKCTDIDECSQVPGPCNLNADCKNTEGSHTCTCKNGYTGNGYSCQALPKTCDEILKSKPTSTDGKYTIDPDGPGDLISVEVYCDMMVGMGVTMMYPLTETFQIRTSPEYTVVYKQTIPQIQAVANNSGFCFQYLSATCASNAVMLSGDDYWVDGKDNKQYNWGGSKSNGKCVCGQIGACLNPNSNCNCDGSVSGKTDDGKIIEKDLLPIKKIYIGGLTGNQRMDLVLGPVTCGPKPFGFPIDCDDAKFNSKITKDGPQIIDIDGPDKPGNPVLVHCDMESYPHVGITVIVHDKTKPTVPSDTDTPLVYTAKNEDIDRIIQESKFCRQDVSYNCVNSPIATSGNTKFTDSDGNTIDYWPGGMPGMCACGLTKTCADPNKVCNCDIVDGMRRQDFGAVTNKGDLPVGAIVSKDAGINSTYTVGPLRCSRTEFGFEATCQGYFDKGSDISYTYWIDPDGPPPKTVVDLANVDAFPVRCLMVKEPPHAVTIVHHEDESYVKLIGDFVLRYYYVSSAQFIKLRKRTVYCTQGISFSCSASPIFTAAGAQVKWYDMAGNAQTYFSGKKTTGCACAANQQCAGGSTSLCNCDMNDNQIREDTGSLIDKNDLPVVKLTGSGPSVTVGPLQCYDTYPTCSDLYWFMMQSRLSNEKMVVNGVYTIDPDGAGGVNSFKAICKFPQTEIPLLPGVPTNTTNPNDDNPVTKCFDITYNYGISPAQLQALIDNSRVCTQELVFNCKNAPLKQHVHYKTCDNKIQPGWAGSNGADKCACGVTGTCSSAAGETNDCNCEVQDGATRSDKGSIYDKTALPVCQVCITLDPVTSNQPSRSASYEVSSLFCSNSNIGVFGTCQARRDQTTLQIPSDTVFIDPDGFNTGNPPFPVFCEIQAHPPAGIIKVNPKTDKKPIPQDGGNITITYYVFKFEYVKVVVEQSVFCEQEVYILCNGSPPPTTRGDYDDWVVTGDGRIECKPGGCSCDDGLIYGGFIKAKQGLPLQIVSIGPSNINRELYIGPMTCYDMYRDCHDIKVRNAATGWRRGHTYAIDPDNAGGVKYFEVQCDFTTNTSIGITIVYGQPDTIAISGQVQPGTKTIAIVYPTATPEQIHVLSKQSGFCSQGIQYECKETGLLSNRNNPDGYYLTYGGKKSSSFGTGFLSDVEGCACVLTDTCPAGKLCHCDAKGSMVDHDYGIITDRNVLPVIQLDLGGQTSPSASSKATVGDVRCGPTPFDLPKDCEDVYLKGFKSGEFMIWPNKNQQPYIVYCDMDIVPNHGVTVIGHDHEDPTPIKEPDSTVKVTYNTATDEQVGSLTDVSKFCYQPIKFDCFNTHFIGYGKFYWTGSNGQSKYYLGSGKSALQQCSCANDSTQCGGDQTKATLQTRKCSCDAGELQWRSDAGVFSSAADLPVLSMTFLPSARVNETGIIKLGKLYCAQVEFDLNECITGFNDCHEKATCTNKPGTFECRCKEGWQGKGVSGVWANGRNCYDNNECAEGICPYSSDCENTPGSFICHCHAGYRQSAPTVCTDIDECFERTHNCDANAVCTNLPGSFHCRCKRGYRGNGTHCTPLGICSCFGDPHCISYDQKFLHFQGNCQYIMSQDGCNGSDHTFQVLTKHWNKNIPGLTDATWIEKVTFMFPNHVVVLGQDHVVLVDGIRRTLPVQTETTLIRKRGEWIEVYTSIGVQVNWDGHENVEVNVPPNYRDKMCGLCGNYNNNPKDDWIVGPACAGQGQITDNQNKFGHSYVDVSYRDSNPQCKFDCNEPPPPPEPCTGIDKQLAESYCDKVFGLNGKFKTCLLKLEDFMYTNVRASCIFDACKLKDDKSAVVCKAAENLVKECQENYDTEFVDWRTDAMCTTTCGEGKEYVSCANENNTRSCDSRTSDIAKTEVSCRAGCYCKSGLVMDGDKCVKPEQCGCLYNDFYYSVGQTFVDETCTKVYTCEPNRSFSSRPLTCNENATCGNEEGIYGCHCKKGFMGNGEECKFDPCGSKPCHENEYCVVDGSSYLCECKMGYQGDCNNCQDIDECATKTDTCPPHSRCVNTEGSYRCDCIKGYTSSNKRCEDIDECEIGSHNCGSGTKCYNTPGSYHCEPCSAKSPPGKCCACYGAKCNIPGNVCGTNGKTYNTEADLIIDRCESGKRIHVDYRGTCQDTCPEENICPKWQNCSVDEATGVPSCKCEPCTESEMLNTSIQVCSDKLDLYENMCMFKKLQCAMDREDVPIIDTTSPCKEKSGEDIVTEWSPWSPCSVTCGSGTMNRERHSLVQFDAYLEEKYKLGQISSCYKPPCPGSSCESINCNTSQVCVESETGEGFCICPDCTNIGEDPVCGKIGNQNSKTFENPCELAKKACEEAEPYEQLYVGTCGTLPVNCTKMPNFQVPRNGAGCLSAQKVNLGKCDGGCGAYTNKCCKPITSTIDVVLNCNDHTTDLIKVDVINSCECVPLPPV